MVQTIDKFRSIIRIDSVWNQEDLDSIFSDYINDLQINDYSKHYFVFPNYSKKYYECKKDVTYIPLSIDQIQNSWDMDYDMYYKKDDNNQYVSVGREYMLIEDVEGLNIPPDDFFDNYSQYYTKNGNTYIPLT
jgi:hypothetical protein